MCIRDRARQGEVAHRRLGAYVSDTYSSAQFAHAPGEQPNRYGGAAELHHCGRAERRTPAGCVRPRPNRPSAGARGMALIEELEVEQGEDTQAARAEAGGQQRAAEAHGAGSDSDSDDGA